MKTHLIMPMGGKNYKVVYDYDGADQTVVTPDVNTCA